LCESEQDKGWFRKIEDEQTIAVVHITKVDKKRSKGLYRYFFPPRIGIDFYTPDNYPEGQHDFIPNLELGDVARLIKILELVDQDKTFNSLREGEIQPFEIGLAFENELKRKITVSVAENSLAIKYEGIHRRSEVSIEYNFTRQGIQELINCLKELTIEYIGFIQRYVLIGRMDPKFK
jgi:hypothetical protein